MVRTAAFSDLDASLGDQVGVSAVVEMLGNRLFAVSDLLAPVGNVYNPSNLRSQYSG